MGWLIGRFLHENKPLVYYVLLLAIHASLSAQNELPRYRVLFSGKDSAAYSIENPEDFLSLRAIQRREINNVAITPEDFPVSREYIRKVRFSGGRVITVSKWFNSAIVEVKDSSAVTAIKNLPFVKQIKQVYYPNFEKRSQNKFESERREYAPVPLSVNPNDYGFAFEQIALHKGQRLHSRGFRGEDVVIAVIDAGFYKVNEYPIFDSLWMYQRILGVKDFVHPGGDVYAESTHGMRVLSIIGGNIPRAYVGTAPEASFWLLRSEDARSEFIVEEDYWVAAAEFADSAGANVINTSLGYSIFDKPSQNHSYAEMNGASTLITKATNIAASKGISVIISAGNEGRSTWGYITAPADAFDMLTIGAINTEGEIARFSSRGPTYDGRIKPDVVATGWGTYTQSSGSPNEIVRGNGTSFSAPLIAGLTACLIQAFPGKPKSEILQAIRESSDKYSNPDTAFGYGIPDYELAYHILKFSEDENQSFDVIIQPNPVSDFVDLKLLFIPEPAKNSVIRIFDMKGNLVYSNRFSVSNHFARLRISLPSSMKSGMYLLHLTGGNNLVIKKFLKL